MFAQDFLGFSAESPHPRIALIPKQIRVLGHFRHDLRGCPSQTGKTVFCSHFLPFSSLLWSQTRQHVVPTAVGSLLPTAREAGPRTTHGRR